MTTTNNMKKAQTFMQTTGLSRAQDARRLMKESPRDRHRTKVLQALRWIHGWGQTTLKLLLAACGTTKSDFLTKLKEHGYVRTEYVIGRTFWILNKSGVDLLRSMSGPDDELAGLSGTRHVNLFSFTHNMFAQAVLAQKLSKGGHGCKWWCDRQIRALLDPSEAATKSPDAAFQDTAGNITYIEIERCAKKQPELECMILNLARLVEKKKSSTGEIYIAEGILGRYQSTLGQWISQGSFRAWSLSADNELYVSGVYPVSPALDNALRRIRLIPTKITAA